jgi:hypothetical protein
MSSSKTIDKAEFCSLSSENRYVLASGNEIMKTQIAISYSVIEI